MMIYKKVLVAVDDSSTSKILLKEMIKFAKEQPDSFFRIAHVGGEFFINWDDETITTPHIELSTLQEAWLAMLKNIEVELHAAKVSNFETVLIKSADTGTRVAEDLIGDAVTWGADLIMIGTHGRRGLHHFFLGSVAEQVIHIAPVPVLLVRASEDGGNKVPQSPFS